MKHILLLLLVLAFTRGNDSGAATYDKEIATIADKISAAVAKKQIKKISILDFTDLQDNPSELGRFLADQLTVALVGEDRGFAIVNKARRKDLIAELKLSESALVNPDNAKSFGKISGVDALIYGRITTLAEEIIVSVTLTAVETTDIISGVQGRISNSADMKMVAGRGNDGGPPVAKVVPNNQPGQSIASGRSLDLVKLVQVEKNSTQSVF